MLVRGRSHRQVRSILGLALDLPSGCHPGPDSDASVRLPSAARQAFPVAPECSKARWPRLARLVASLFLLPGGVASGRSTRGARLPVRGEQQPWVGRNHDAEEGSVVPA